MAPTQVPGSTIARLNDTCGNVIQITQLRAGRARESRHEAPRVASWGQPGLSPSRVRRYTPLVPPRRGDRPWRDRPSEVARSRAGNTTGPADGGR